MTRRFGVLVGQDAPFDELGARFRLLEELGFEFAFVSDHAANFRDPDGFWLDAGTALALAAVETSTIRVGTLVSNPILRHPAVLALEARAIDHLSNGRLELGLGTGIASWDHNATGTEVWGPRERAARFAEYAEVLDGILRSESGTYRYEGRYLSTFGPARNPPPVQQPRPPLTVAGQAPTVRRVAAERADCWNTHGPFGRSYEDIVAITRDQSAKMDEALDAAGRAREDLRRSVLLFRALDPWTGGPELERSVSDFAALGFGEFVLMWPDEGAPALERAAAAIGSLR